MRNLQENIGGAFLYDPCHEETQPPRKGIESIMIKVIIQLLDGRAQCWHNSAHLYSAGGDCTDPPIEDNRGSACVRRQWMALLTEVL